MTTPPPHVAAIVLAAGQSERMGELKPLLPFGRSTVLGTVLDTLEAAGLRDIVVVIGHAADSVAAAMADRPVRLVHNRNYQEGMLSSIQAGLGVVMDDCTGALIVLGDQPLVEPPVIRALLAQHGETPEAILIPQHGGKRGHPVLIPQRYLEEVLGLAGPPGLHALMRAHPDAIRELACDSPGILIDLDTPEDYAQALARRAQNA